MKKSKKPANNDETIRAELGSGNVFRDIGSKNPDEALMKAEVAMVIGKLIRQMDMNQAQVARTLGIDQPKVSLLLRGRLKDFSIMRLFRFLRALEQDIQIVITPHKSSRKGGAAEAVKVELVGV